MRELAVFPDLSVEENLKVGAQALGHATVAEMTDNAALRQAYFGLK